MLRTKNMARHRRYHVKDERGIVIVLVAVMMLFVVGAMAALSIDVVTLYTARSEAQLAADAAALAGARVIANSGATSDTTLALLPLAEPIARAVAIQVAMQNQVGGANLTAPQVTPSFGGSFTDPTITVQVQVPGLPAFFSRIWGNKQFTVSASATAEAYNPSGTTVGGQIPVAPFCVKPWLVPNMDPSNAGKPIFDPTTGAITSGSNLLGWSSTSTGGVAMSPACNGVNGSCIPMPSLPLTQWTYFPGDDATTFPPPPTPSCSTALTTPYQFSIAGCIQIPISCSSPVGNPAKIDPNPYPGSGRSSDTTDAVNCLTHATASGGGDTVTPPVPLTAPFQFIAGAGNPLVAAGALTTGANTPVSDSLVTVPVFDVNSYNSGAGTAAIIGFVQLFLNPNGAQTLPLGSVNTTVINLAGCGSAVAGTAINGNGASPVAVRLITPP